jgi:hypothetical protein
MGPVVVKQNVMVTPLGHVSGLLGLDFIQDHTTMCDIKSGKIVIKSCDKNTSVVDLLPEKRQEQSARVSLCHHVTVNPHEEVRVTASVEKAKLRMFAGCENATVEGCNTSFFHDNVLISAACVSPMYVISQSP